MALSKPRDVYAYAFVGTIPIVKSKLIIKRQTVECNMHLPTEMSSDIFYPMAFEIFIFAMEK